MQNNVRVAVLGASGGIGQPLSLLLKMSPKVSELRLFDIQHTLGVAADLSHIDTPAHVTGYNGPDQLLAALKGMYSCVYDLVVRIFNTIACRRLLSFPQTFRSSSFPPACRANRAWTARTCST